MIDKLGDPFLNDVALGLLIFMGLMLFYGIIAIHDIPYKISKKRDHPHQDAIHAAGWVSLFTLHALWPFLWIWAMSYRPERGWGFSQAKAETGEPELLKELQFLRSRLAQLDTQIEELKSQALKDPAGKIGPVKAGDAAPTELNRPTAVESGAA